ncbi:MAG: beta-ketoacyl-[acyl-carrier-protein] synthase family protein [Candidatus Omnitrophica bacterium]|nr:beta-ketoacyl-[acyl-carrier-protein] synthase family protein [Candidatus Omnitrophota bacterium]
MQNKKRIVITGLGAITSIGIGIDEFWNALIRGKSGISRIESLDTSVFPTHNGGEVKNFDALRFMSRRKAAKLGRASQFTISAAKLALSDAGLNLSDLDAEKTGVCLGTTMGESQILESLNDAWIRKGVDAIDPLLVPRYPCNVLSTNLAIEFKLRGPNLTIPNACAAANFATGFASDLMNLGEADTMLVGGSDAFSRIAFIGFNRMFAVAPEKCQPFDKNRKGMMVAEGAGIIVLETLDKAVKRKAHIYAELLGYGVSCDAHHMTAPQADGISRAITSALKHSGISPGQVDYFNAHGTGTPANDREESMAIKKVFGENYKKVAVSSIKSMLGHTMGAASALETIACSMAIENNMIPPTINYETPDPQIEYRLCP